MSEHTNISWTDSTWPITSGCSRVDDDCTNCYAIRDTHRMASNPNPAVSAVYSDLTVYRGTRLDWNGKTKTLPQRLDWPAKWKPFPDRPRRIFVGNESDIFHPTIPFEFIDDVWQVMADHPEHTFQVLTKRPQRLLVWQKWTDAFGGGDYLPNVWIGTSVGKMEGMNRLLDLIKCDAAIHFLSAEPLRGGLNLPDEALETLDWVITGAESGGKKKRRPMNEDWVRALRDQCVSNGIAFFYKQSIGSDGKKIHNPVLDGRKWEEFPEVTA